MYYKELLNITVLAVLKHYKGILFPITLRGVFVIWITYLAIFVFGQKESDLVSSIVGAILAIITFFSLTVSVLYFIRIKKTLKLENLSSTNDIYSKEEQTLYIRISNFSVPPLFILYLRRKFNKDITLGSNGKIVCQDFKLTGSYIEPETLSGLVSFPHRGTYREDSYQFILKDYFGLFKWKWNIPSDAIYQVYPPPKTIETLPVMLASSVSGDLSTATDIRSGDLFDSKQYQRGDSLKRVLWKVYARSEELIVRHPEPAIIPEGELVSYSLALPEEDWVISANISYLEQASSQNVKYLASFLGAGAKIASSLEDLKGLSLYPPSNLELNLAAREFKEFIETLNRNNAQVFEVILFCPLYSHKVRNKRQEYIIESLNDVMRLAEDMGIKAFIAEVPLEDNNNLPLSSISNHPNTYMVKFTY